MDSHRTFRFLLIILVKKRNRYNCNFGVSGISLKFENVLLNMFSM